jgi:anti-sigma factor RsiW
VVILRSQVEKERYNDQTIIQYLLGALPEEETERVEELCFIDDEFAVRLTAVENDLVDAYVRGRLAGERLERFDSHYLASPKRRKKVKTARMLHAYAENAVATGQVVLASGPSQTNAKSFKPSPRLTRLPFTLPRLALTAAAALALVGAGLLAFELSRLRSQIDQAQATRIALEQREKELQGLLEQQRSASSVIEKELERVREEKERVERQIALERQIAGAKSPASPASLNILPFILTAPARTAGQVAAVTIPSGTDYVVLQAELEPDDYSSYNAELLYQPGKTPAGWKRERLRSRALGESRVVDIVIPANILKSREYLLAVTGISDRGSAEGERGYPFRIVKQ